jgi:hypothetical protein
MSIISKQTGYSNGSNLLYAILKEVDDICKALGPTPTTTTTTTGNFSGMVSWGVDSASACAGTNSFIMTTDNSPTFCSSIQTAYMGAGWGSSSINTGIYYISYNGSVRRVYHTAGDDYSIGADFDLCTSC